MTDLINLLWSGGVDSTVMAAELGRRGFKVMLHHIKIRRGTGKDLREASAIAKLLPELKKRFPEMSFLEHKYRISPCPDRNLKMILFLKTVCGENPTIAVGTLRNDDWDPHYTEDDGDDEKLSRNSGASVITWDTLGVHAPEQIGRIGRRLLGQAVLDMTWSCQLWFRKPCGKCYSCRRRAKLINPRRNKNENKLDSKPVEPMGIPDKNGERPKNQDIPAKM